jgi:ribose 5-phosphate isomerase A
MTVSLVEVGKSGSLSRVRCCESPLECISFEIMISHFSRRLAYGLVSIQAINVIYFQRQPFSSCSTKSDEAKKVVGYHSIDEFVKSGMVVGLGTGSTAKFAVERLGQKLKSGQLKGIIAIPTSEATKSQAMACQIPLTTLNEISAIDVAIDGADQVDKNFNLIKGGGGALLREKMVEMSSKKFIVIIDDTKLVESLGPGFPLPVEITPFCYEHTIRQIESLPSFRGTGCHGVLRVGSVSNNLIDGTEIAVTDNGNYIVDLHFKEPLVDAELVDHQLNQLVGVVEHGLFIQMASLVLVANAQTGEMTVLTPKTHPQR